MPANFMAILLELHRRVPGRAMCAGLLWLAKQVNILLALSVSLVFVGDLVRPARGCGRSQGAVRNEVGGVVRAIDHFQLQHKDRCPRDADELKSAGVLSRTPKDPWGRPFVIECSHTGIRVCSHGDDEADPGDDVCHEEGHYLPLPGSVVGPKERRP